MLILNVPYEEKDEAKALGAKWNPGIKKWYVQNREDYSKFYKWIIQQGNIVVCNNLYVLEQYAGRLNRDYAGKQNVMIYDYVDSHIPMFDNMYVKRLKAYKQIGYELVGVLQTDKQVVNAIYDGDNYSENYHKDLLDANKNIIISSPAISEPKVYELINMLKEKQMSGVQITIVTWTPDSYGFGDAAYWMQLHEDMRKAGFYIKTVEESCERFAVIDQEVVWYGNINLLAKDKIDDSVMRVISKEIASELMELTFGNKDS